MGSNISWVSSGCFFFGTFPSSTLRLQKIQTSRSSRKTPDEHFLLPLEVNHHLKKNAGSRTWKMKISPLPKTNGMKLGGFQPVSQKTAGSELGLPGVAPTLWVHFSYPPPPKKVKVATLRPKKNLTTYFFPEKIRKPPEKKLVHSNIHEYICNS